jgi:glucose-6-phosphate 1-epimerase
MKNLETLNNEFSIPSHVRFVKGNGGLDVVELQNSSASVRVVLMGAHVLSYKPANSEDVLWFSEKSAFAPGKPIRGGIPICFPWFGAHSADQQKPTHGFARLKPWTVLKTKAEESDCVECTLSLCNNEETFQQWPYAFECILSIDLNTELKLSLSIRNNSSETMTITAGFHPYFNIGDIHNVEVKGLEETEYIDRVDGAQGKIQKGSVKITSETNNLYGNTAAVCEIIDCVLRRSIIVKKENSNATVVWNPWAEKCAAIPDMNKDDYLTMVCVETVKAGEDVIIISPGKTFTFSTILSVNTL